ncbi:helix-turn-helix domain-containing protein [Picosynechococcus sp. PCC 8807]|uniref:helix-turn-helix domain-containing protein n=1 Tax=Picosynechococcus sp. PCC 8807 TaxID=195248 RepID=UPI0008103A8F|nr:helix-turn-helix domain-containing protein [Picosynechococcus sp. PCC 8807]ANV92019.1 hypothetical protein AWQ24_14665 [Picosynechococcus sp. PCC 8807]
MSKWITTAEMAQALGISTKHLHRLRQSRRFPKKGYWRDISTPDSRPDYRWNKPKILALFDGE